MPPEETVIPEAKINRALGVFMLFFGAVILVAVFFTETAVGKLTNLAAGGIIVLIGALLWLRAGVVERRQNADAVTDSQRDGSPGA